jgi:hypothetical protein
MHEAQVGLEQNMHFSWQKEREILQENSEKLSIYRKIQASVLQNPTVLLNQSLCFLYVIVANDWPLLYECILSDQILHTTFT